MSNLRKVAIHRSLVRPQLLMGGDRELVLSLVTVCAMLIFAIFTWTAAVMGIMLLLVGMYVLKLMAKSDPQLRQVYLRHIKYRLTYAARSLPWRTR